MLRITRHDQEVAAVTLKLEGRLTGPWSQELDRVAGDAIQGGTALVLDLSDLMFVDSAGLTCSGRLAPAERVSAAAPRS